MNLTRKIEIIERSITSLTRHDDEDAAVRHAALDHVIRIIEAERSAIEERVKARIAETLKPTGA